MPKFMIVGVVGDEIFTSFAHQYSEAQNKKLEIECGLGGCAEIYSREQTESGSEYVFLES